MFIGEPVSEVCPASGSLITLILDESETESFGLLGQWGVEELVKGVQDGLWLETWCLDPLFPVDGVENFGVVLGEFGLDELGPVGLEILISCGVPGLIDDPIMDKSLHIGFTDVGFEVGQKLESLFVRNGGECIVWVLSLGEREKT